MKRDPEIRLAEPIGNGIIRVNLAAVKPEDLEALGQVFLVSAAVCRGERERFLEKLKLLRKLTREEIFSFGEEALEGYREAYKPAYRILKRK